MKNLLDGRLSGTVARTTNVLSVMFSKWGLFLLYVTFFLPDKNSFQAKPNGYSCPVELLVFSGVRDLFCV